MLALCCLLAAPPSAGERPKDLESIKQEPKLEKRAKFALKFAKSTLNKVLPAYRKGDVERGEALLMQIQEAVELAYESLMDTGKNARKKPKHFKRAEIRTRRLLKEFDSLQRNLNYDERKVAAEVQARISEINDKLLMAIMTKKK